MSEILEQLQDSLERESALVEQFISVLQIESETLIQAKEVNELEAVTREKSRYAGLLAQMDQDRQAQLGKLGFEPNKAGLDAAALAYPSLRQASQSLLDLARQASDLNTSNGAIIDIYLQHNQQAIDTLRRLVGVDHLYDASGRAHSMPAHKTNIKAG